MSDDLLRRATRALRKELESPPAASAMARARIMRSLHRRQKRRLARMVGWVPLAAIFVGASAAAASGRLPEVWQRVSVAVGLSEPARAALGPPSSLRRSTSVARRRAQSFVTQARVRSVERGPELDIPAEPPPRIPPTGSHGSAMPPPRTNATGGPRATAAVPTPRTVSAPGASAPPTALQPAPARELERYRDAHHRHFQARDATAALAAWDRYLSDYPHGRFATEARYNRALCLVRLQRPEQARAALAPFARGSYGGYREKEARELLDAL